MEKTNYFDNKVTPLVYGSQGVNLDFVKHKNAEEDPDLVAGELCDILAANAPIIALEKSLTASGAAQTLLYRGPRVSDLKLGSPLRLVGVELALQLNNLAIPNSDFKFIVKFLNYFGDEIESMTQEITGTASILNGNTRQYIRLLSFQRFGSYSDEGAISFMDGRSVNFLPFMSVSSVDKAAFTAIVPDAVAKTVFPDLTLMVDTISIEIPVASMTAGVVVTLTPLVSGRQDTLESIVYTLDKLGAAVAAPADMSNKGTKLLF